MTPMTSELPFDDASLTSVVMMAAADVLLVGGINNTLTTTTTTTSPSVVTVDTVVCVESLLEAKGRSRQGTLSSLSSDSPICRICHCGDDDAMSLDGSLSSWNASTSSPEDNNAASGQHQTIGGQVDDTSSVPVQVEPELPISDLITPCFCCGSLRYVHHYCLQQWIRSSNHKYCELCKFHFKMTVKHKPFLEWERLEMSPGERKKLLCNLLFNLISMFCVFWSIYVLIERATLEAKYGLLDWPFWTKMLVVSIGFLGGTVFLFVQLRLYFTIFLRWRQFNRVIVIHSADDGRNSSSKETSGSSLLQLDSVDLVK